MYTQSRSHTENNIMPRIYRTGRATNSLPSQNFVLRNPIFLGPCIVKL
jgi:hypothetical protein